MANLLQIQLSDGSSFLINHGVDQFIETQNAPNVALRIDPRGNVITGGQFREGDMTLEPTEYFRLVENEVHVRGVIDEVGAGQNILYGILDETLPSSPANPLNGFTLDEVHGPQTPLIGVLREVVL